MDFENKPGSVEVMETVTLEWRGLDNVIEEHDTHPKTITETSE